MVSGWTLPGLLSAEPLSKIMESCIEKSNCCNQGRSVEDKRFQLLLWRPELGFWLELGPVINRSGPISLSPTLTLRFFQRSDRWSSDVFPPADTSIPVYWARQAAQQVRRACRARARPALTERRVSSQSDSSAKLQT